MNSQSEDQSPSSPVPAFGELLRQAREERGISIEQLSEHTRISRQHIYDLENNDASGISSYGYVIGYLNTLANFLAIDANAVINAFKVASNQETRTSTLEEFVEPQSTGGLPKDYSKALLVSVLSILVLAIGAVLAYWFLVMQKEQQDDSLSSREDVTEEMTDPSEVEEIRENQDISQTKPAEEDGQYSVEDDELNESVEESEGAEDGESLVFEFAEESWLVVRDGAGNILVNGVQAAGSKLELDGEQPFSIRLGYAHGVRIEFLGEEISLDPYISEGEDQAQLTLPQ